MISKNKASALLKSINNDITNDNDKDPYKILTSRLLQANTKIPTNHTLTIQLDIKEPELYNREM